MPLDADLDALYQLPLAEFVAARNALGRQAGDRAGDVKALQKPNAAAWAVNQLYWKKRDLFDALAKAAEGLRRAHVRRLEGRGADPKPAEAQHVVALGHATAAARAFLNQAGEPASDATAEAIKQTLAAVPSPEIRGRLTRPVHAASGFGQLASLLEASGRGPAGVVSMRRGQATGGSAAKGGGAAARRAATLADRRARAQATRDLRAAEAADQAAAAALTRARQRAQRADARVDQLEQALGEARSAAGAAREAADHARLAANDAAAARVRPSDG